MDDKPRTKGWWVQSIIHHVIVHPLIPLADALDGTRHHKIARFIFLIHDETAATEDEHRMRTM